MPEIQGPCCKKVCDVLPRTELRAKHAFLSQTRLALLCGFGQANLFAALAAGSIIPADGQRALASRAPSSANQVITEGGVRATTAAGNHSGPRPEYIEQATRLNRPPKSTQAHLRSVLIAWLYGAGWLALVTAPPGSASRADGAEALRLHLGLGRCRSSPPFPARRQLLDRADAAAKTAVPGRQLDSPRLVVRDGRLAVPGASLASRRHRHRAGHVPVPIDRRPRRHAAVDELDGRHHPPADPRPLLGVRARL